MPWRRVGEWMYSFTSWPPYSTRSGWLRVEENSFIVLGIELRFLGRPTRGLATIPAELSRDLIRTFCWNYKGWPHTSTPPYVFMAWHLEPKTFTISFALKVQVVGRDNSVGIATRYRLDGPGIQCRWGQDFPHPSTLTLWPSQPPIQPVPGLFPGGKAAGVWRWPPTAIRKRG